MTTLSSRVSTEDLIEELQYQLETVTSELEVINAVATLAASVISVCALSETIWANGAEELDITATLNALETTKLAVLRVRHFPTDNLTTLLEAAIMRLEDQLAQQYLETVSAEYPDLLMP